MSKVKTNPLKINFLLFACTLVRRVSIRHDGLTLALSIDEQIVIQIRI
jgi:hypothetical protein